MINEKAEFEYYNTIEKWKQADFKKFFNKKEPQLKRAFIILLRGYLFEENKGQWNKDGSFNKDIIKNAVKEVRKWAMEFARNTCSVSDKQWCKLELSPDSKLKKYAIIEIIEEDDSEKKNGKKKNDKKKNDKKSYYISQDTVTELEQDCSFYNCKNETYNKKAIDILNQVFTSATDFSFDVNNFRNCLSAFLIEAISQGKLRDTDYVLIDENYFDNNLKGKNGDAKYVIVTAHQKMLLKNNPDASLTKLDIKALQISLGIAPSRTAVDFLENIKTFIDSVPYNNTKYLSVGQPYFDKVFLPEEKGREKRSFDKLKSNDIPEGFVAVKIGGHNLKECFGDNPLIKQKEDE